jgi:dTDP-glucose 4,6-dehydratase
MLVTSSGAVYGRQPEDLSHIPESYRGGPDPMNQASAYGEGKRLVELMCSLTPKVDTLVARCFSFVGPHLPMNARFAAGNFIRDALAGGPIMVRGDGRAIRSYLYAADLVIWLLTLLLRGQPGRAYNVGSEAAISILELARSTSQSSGRPIDVQTAPTFPDTPPSSYVPDVARARSELMLDIWIDLPDALHRTLDWASRDMVIR